MLFCEYHGEDTQEFIEKSANLFRLHKKKQKFLDLLLQEEMLDGLNKGEFQTFFQPKIFSEEKNIEFEALVRWFHPEKGMISPEIFIPIAEKDFVINKITEKVLKDSIEFAQKINSKISVNISPVVFQNINFLKDMEEIFKNREIAELITLEITEGVALNDYSNAVEKMNAIKKIGLELSIDDFGTGYSSLSYLENFPISELKIDKSFIRNLHTNKINPLIINFVVKLGKISGFKVIAEGVETEKDIKTLMSLGCHNFQGFYFDKPQPSEIIYEKYSSNVYGDMIDKLKNNLL
jgi:EAL domain-containing protein (putative c-di-GMP-specific phosphodiesterase class I)